MLFAEFDQSLIVFAILSSTSIGLGAMLGAFFGRPYYWQAVNYVERDFAAKLRPMHIATHNLRTQIILWSLLLAATFVGFLVFGNSIIFAILVTAIFFCGPWYVVRRMATAYREKIEEQLADSMVSMSSAIKAGLSLPQSLELLADQSPKPINREFGRIVGEYELGKPLDKTLEEAKERLRSENFALFSAAVLASRESGGRLNETIDRIAHSVRELQRLERKVISETAMARRSAIYMAMAPVFIMVAYYFVDPDAITLLFTTPIGHLLLAASVILNIAAYLWAHVILNPDI